ncbi:MAG: hypothetical protein ACMUIG_10280, partial [Thermoplasmatota archaeon]
GKHELAAVYSSVGLDGLGTAIEDETKNLIIILIVILLALMITAVLLTMSLVSRNFTERSGPRAEGNGEQPSVDDDP